MIEAGADIAAIAEVTMITTTDIKRAKTRRTDIMIETAIASITEKARKETKKAASTDIGNNRQKRESIKTRRNNN